MSSHEPVPRDPSPPAASERRAAPLLVNGLRCLEAGDPAGAALYLDSHLAVNADDADGHNLAGVAKRQLGDASGARAHFERAIVLTPVAPLYAVNLAMLLADGGESEQALKVLEPPLRAMPGQPDALITRALILQRMRRFDEAIAVARMAIGFNPQIARAHHALGTALIKTHQSKAAAAAFLEATRLEPAYAEAWINAGVALKECGDLAGAEQSYRRALALVPRDPILRNNLGNVLSSLGRADEAIGEFHTALELDPAYVEAKANLAMVMRDNGDLDGAIDLLAAAVHEYPRHAAVLNTYGNTLRQAERYDEAIAVLQQSIDVNPDFGEAQNNLGLAYALKGKMEDAARHLGRAAALRPDAPVICNNYGALLLRMFRFKEAIQALGNAIARQPDYDDALINLGIANYMVGNAEEAISAYKRVIARNPDSSFAHYSLAVSYLEDQRLSECEEEIKRALELDPKNALAQNTLGVLMLDQHRITDARTAMLAAADVNTASAPIFYSNYAFSCLYEPDLSNADILAIHKEYGRRYATVEPDMAQPHRNIRDPERKLKLAYLSPDFRAHSVAYFFEALLEKHDRCRFEVLLYSDTTRADVVTDSMRAAADQWLETGGLTTEVFARKLASDGVDIVVNLGGHTSGNRLPVCALKPAPVQIEYLGYPETSGVPAMGYRISDIKADPLGAEGWCTEELVRLPHCFHCYRPHGKAPDPAPPPFLKKGYVTFGSFNVLPKLTEPMIAVWARILAAVPSARLYLKCKQLRDERMQTLVRNLFGRYGVAPDRLIMQAFVTSVQDHLNCYGEVDLGLDTFPYNGTTTTCEALWMGVPVLTLKGDSHRSRVGYSLLDTLGLGEEFVADNADAYVTRAVALAAQPQRLVELRAALRMQMSRSPLRDEVGFTRTLEDTYRRLWRRWCEGPETTMLKPPGELRPEDSIQGVLIKTL